MTLLEGTLALSIMSGITYTTIELANEVEAQHAIYQQAQQQQYKQIKNIVTRKATTNE